MTDVGYGRLIRAMSGSVFQRDETNSWRKATGGSRRFSPMSKRPEESPGVESGSTGGVKFDTYQLPGGTSYRGVADAAAWRGAITYGKPALLMVTAACDLTQAKSRSA